MELLIAILLWLGVYATPDTIENPDFRKANEEQFDHMQRIIDNHWYYYDSEGGVVIDEGVGG